MSSPAYVVLGATGGIGHSLCERLSKQGASLLLGGRDEERLAGLAEHGPKAVVVLVGAVVALAGGNPFVLKMVVNGLESAPAVLIAVLLLDRLDAFTLQVGSADGDACVRCVGDHDRSR